MSDIKVNQIAAYVLYEKLQGFQVDDDQNAFRFMDRLADENAWDRENAEAIWEEYKRFLVLSQYADHSVTPSDAVDQVWHLHLVYTDSYWNKLCGNLLGRPLHHCPTEGGKQQQQKYYEQYKRTLSSYQQIFGEDPPEAIWPDPEIRFSQQTHFQRIDINQLPIAAVNSTASGKVWNRWVKIVSFAFFSVGVYYNWVFVAFVAFLAFVMLGGSSSASAGTGGDSGCGGGCGGCGG